MIVLAFLVVDIIHMGVEVVIPRSEVNLYSFARERDWLERVHVSKRRRALCDIAYGGCCGKSRILDILN